MHVVQDRNDVLPAVVCKIGDVLDICGFLESVAHNILFLVHGAF